VKPLGNPVDGAHDRVAGHTHITADDAAVFQSGCQDIFEFETVLSRYSENVVSVRLLQRRNLAHDGDRPTITDHNLDVILNIKDCLLESALPVRACVLHRFAAEFGRAQVALVNQFFLAFHVVVKRRVGEAQMLRHVLQRCTAETLLIETGGRRPQDAVALQFETGFLGWFGHSEMYPLEFSLRLHYFNQD
jgi:hypothetical protein